MAPPLTREQLEELVFAMHREIDGACHAIAGVLDRDQIEPLSNSVDRLICALADAREALAGPVGDDWPSELGPPLRCGTLGAAPPKAPTGILEWRDGRPVRPPPG